MGDKTAARNIAREVGVPIIPGTDSAILNKEEAVEWCEKNGIKYIVLGYMESSEDWEQRISNHE